MIRIFEVNRGYSIAKGYINNKSCLNEENESTGIRCNGS